METTTSNRDSRLVGDLAVNNNSDATESNVTVGPLSTPESLRPKTPRPRLLPATDSVLLVRQGSRYVPAQYARFRNSLLRVVGLLELANACDFAANVWNEVPVPAYAVALMAIGGLVALVISLFALRDARLSWANIRLLRENRRRLRHARTQRVRDLQSVLAIDVLLDVSFRELWTEVINRCGMDVLLGCGAILISVGTWMAIDGADYNVWVASNLLSGYVGNAPLAVYGAVNAAWLSYIWLKAHRHKKAGEKVLRGSPVLAQLRRRTRNVQIYTAVGAVTSVIGGVGSMICATMWWGYIILVPVIALSILLSAWWRGRVGYDRPVFEDMPMMDEPSILDELERVAAAERRLMEGKTAILEKSRQGSGSFAALLDFIVSNDLLEDFGPWLSRNKQLSAALFSSAPQQKVISASILSAMDEQHHSAIEEACWEFLQDKGAIHFQNCERYLAEMLGSILCMNQARKGTDSTSPDLVARV